MLKKRYRLTNTKDFDDIYRNGRKFRGEFGMVIVLIEQDSSQPPKFGLVVGKKIGNAVARNLHARRLREIIKIFLDQNNPKEFNGLKFSYIAFKSPEKYQQLKDELLSQLNDAIRFTQSQK